jgi:hypothetical protein
MRLLLLIIITIIITIFGTTPDDRLYEEQSGNAG